MSKIKEIVITELGDEYVAVPVGNNPTKFKGILKTNKTGKEIIEGLMADKSKEEIASYLVEKYNDLNNEEALHYIDQYIEKLDEIGMINH